MKKIINIFAVLLTVFILNVPLIEAAQSVGKVVALRGKATIERRGSPIAAAVKSPLEADDKFSTGPASRAKLLFIDDSVLTLGENTRMSINTFIHEKGKTGTSIFNLMDGKMRSVVSKTRFEVRTPTAVAAARGTVIYFEVGQMDNREFSKILCLEGTVEVRSNTETIPGTVTLTQGKMVIVTANQPLPPAVPAPPSELNKARQNPSQELAKPASPKEVVPDTFVPPVNIQPIQPSKVKIRINAP
jgi:hypothetical protein